MYVSYSNICNIHAFLYYINPMSPPPPPPKKKKKKKKEKKGNSRLFHVHLLKQLFCHNNLVYQSYFAHDCPIDGYS